MMTMMILNFMQVFVYWLSTDRHHTGGGKPDAALRDGDVNNERYTYGEGRNTVCDVHAREV